MANMIEMLLTLQRLDLEMEHLRTGALEYPEREAKAQLGYDGKNKQIETTQTQISTLEKEIVDSKETLRLEEIRLKKSRLRINEIKTNYEYQAMRREIDSTERSNVELQDLIKTKTGEIEQLQVVLKEYEEEVAVLRKALDEVKAEAVEKAGEFGGLLGVKESEQQTLEKEIDRSLLSKYRMIRQRRYKDALVEVIAGACQGCFMNVPPQMENEILSRGAGIYQCPNCQRLLYATETESA